MMFADIGMTYAECQAHLAPGVAYFQDPCRQYNGGSSIDLEQSISIVPDHSNVVPMVLATLGAFMVLRG